MRRTAVVVLVTTVSGGLLFAQDRTPAPARAQGTAQTVAGMSVVRPDEAGISGKVLTPDGFPVANTLVQVRNLLTNEIDGSTRTSEVGEYTILNLDPGNYVLEIVNDDGSIFGTSAFVSATAGTLVPGVTITAATGALTASTSTTGIVAALGATAARGVTAAAAAAGVAGVVAPPEVPIASPSR